VIGNTEVKNHQRGNTVVGVIIGVVLGLAVALAVAVYVTRVPVPFLNKGQVRTPEQDAAESRKNQDWDPNAPLYGRNPARPAANPSASGAVEPQAPAVAGGAGPVEVPALPAAGVAAPGAAPGPGPAAAGPARAGDPLGDLASARANVQADPFLYFVQAGAFRSPDDAEAQRAKLSLMGMEARVTEREQSGRQVFRVRVGPFDRREDADRYKARLDAGGIESALVRVQR
jgi:cell division protein FtsN